MIRRWLVMVHVVESGENFGTLRNIFRDINRAAIFAKLIMEYSDNEYETVGHNEWFCSAKNEYIKIEDTENLLN
jgi:hypothetical protein